MHKLSRFVTIIGLAAGIQAAMPAFAESAPVYDADSISQQYDNSDSTQDLPPPPPPSQENTFVPVQPSASAQPPAAPAAVGTPTASGSSLDQRMKRIEQQLNNSTGPEAASRLESLQNQVQSLRGQVEQLTHQLEQMQLQQKSLMTDIDKRLAQAAQAAKPAVAAPAETDISSAAAGTTKAGRNKLAAKQPKAAATAAAPDNAPGINGNGNQPNVAEEQQIYQTAYNLIKVKKYGEAVTALQGMLQKYPSGQFASNAHYWLGELYGLMNKNDQALTEFSVVVQTYPDSPRVSDAQLKVGLILASQLKWPDAKAALKKVINHYPGTASARLASEQLKQIKQAGH